MAQIQPDSPLTEEEWISQIRKAALENDFDRYRNLLYTEHGRSRLENFRLDPENDDQVRAMMEAVRRQIQEGENFRRNVLSEGKKPTLIEAMAMHLGVTPETLIVGSFAQKPRRGPGKEGEVIE